MGRPHKIVKRKRVDITLSPATLALGKHLGSISGEGFSGLVERLLIEHVKENKHPVSGKHTPLK